MTDTNGKLKFEIPTFGCEGCARRKELLLAGDWKMDAAVILAVAVLCVVLTKVKIPT
jgi:hypothetical protein